MHPRSPKLAQFRSSSPRGHQIFATMESWTFAKSSGSASSRILHLDEVSLSPPLSPMHIPGSYILAPAGFLTGQYKSLDDFDADDYRRMIPCFQGEAFQEVRKTRAPPRLSGWSGAYLPATSLTPFQCLVIPAEPETRRCSQVRSAIKTSEYRHVTY